MDVGKSAIHGLGAFCKVAHKAGDMLTEYVGELVRPPVADARERKVYDRMVGSGTYVFALNEEFCVDATRQGTSGNLASFTFRFRSCCVLMLRTEESNAREGAWVRYHAAFKLRLFDGFAFKEGPALTVKIWAHVSRTTSHSVSEAHMTLNAFTVGTWL